MLTRVDIANYRGFKSYRMEELAQVNLIVGKNNSGKTALLEGIQFLTSGGDSDVLAASADRRGEEIVRGPERPTMVEIGHFFYGHSIAPDVSFSIAGNNGFAPVSVKVIALKEGRPNGEDQPKVRAAPVRFALRVDGPRRTGSEVPLFLITRDGGVNMEEPRVWRSGLPGRPLDEPPVRFIGTEHLDTARIAELWDEVQVAGENESVLSALQLLEPKLMSFFMLSGLSAHGYTGTRAGPMVRFESQDRPIPLGSMGEGMRRLLALSTSLAATSEGFLFVDEIDTGLHYSVMADMWKLVIKKALASNVQVFATTHSWDCIEGLSILCQQSPELVSKVAVHKIDRALQNSVAISGDSLVRMVRSDIDPR